MKFRCLIAFILLISYTAVLSALDWTVLIYMAADNDLASYALHNIEQMEQAEQAQGLDLAVQVDLPDVGAKRYLIRQHPEPGIQSSIIQNLGQLDSGDPQSLQDFINWGFDRYPAQRKMLILWSHADSWYKSPKYIAPDQESGNVIGVANKELEQALRGTAHLDILLFDACSMQSIEIMYELKDLADIIVGSADLVPVYGFPYETMIPLIEGDPELLASRIPQLYTDSYLPGTPNNPSSGYYITTCSAIQTSSLQDFYLAFRAFSAELRSAAPLLAPLREELFEMNSGFADVDLWQFLIRLEQAGIMDVSELKTLLEEIILASSYTLPWIEPDLSSIALWYPDLRFNFDAAWQTYMQLDFAKTGWLSLVNLALGKDNTPPAAPELIWQDQRYGRVYLGIKSPLDVDSLSFRLETTHGEYEINPSAYAPEFVFDFAIESDGSYALYAMDRIGNESQPLLGTYQYQIPQRSMLVRPNPVLDARLAFLEWYLDDSSAESLTLNLYNLRGQRLICHHFEVPHQSPGLLKLDELPGFTKLKRGIYILELSSGGRKMQKKLTILR